MAANGRQRERPFWQPDVHCPPSSVIVTPPSSLLGELTIDDRFRGCEALERKHPAPIQLANEQFALRIEIEVDRELDLVDTQVPLGLLLDR